MSFGAIISSRRLSDAGSAAMEAASAPISRATVRTAERMSCFCLSVKSTREISEMTSFQARS